MRGLAVLSLSALACTLEPAYDRSNPFDPGSPYLMSVVGVPDTVSAIGERFQVDIERDPPIEISKLAITWGAWVVDADSASAPEVKYVANGEFISTSAMTSRLVARSVAAQFSHGVVVGRSFTVGQLVDTLHLSCGSPTVPVACASLPLSVGGTLQVYTNARDRRGFAVQQENFAMQRALVTIRTPGVLTSAVTPNAAGTYAFSATGAGSTWIVIRSDRAVDSVHVTVTP